MLTSNDRESLTELIERFNRKERYIVFQQVATAGEVALDPGFQAKLRALGWPVPDRGVLVLTDYHLNWLYAALELHSRGWASSDSSHKALSDVPSAVDSASRKTRYALEANQEDIDLLLVWEGAGGTHLGLVEVKAYSGWSNKQMRSKAARLEAILGRGGDMVAYEDVVAHFALMSFTNPTGITTEPWPRWMTDDEGQLAHIELDPASSDRLSVGRVDENGKGSRTGGYYGIQTWKI